MLSLSRPKYTAQESYTLCISRVRNPDLKTRLKGATAAVVNASQEYDDAATSFTLHQIVRSSLVAGNVTAKEMEKVYTQRMVDEDAPGREVYDAIYNSSERCPLCGHRDVDTLDHHLPKAHYPALVVAPLNLTPCCTPCNKAKLDVVPRTAESVALHPYYDSIDQNTWLVGDVIETQPAAIRFHVMASPNWSNLLSLRVQSHFRNLGLAELYASQAAEELLHIRHQLKLLHDIGGLPQVRNELDARATSNAAARRNSWRTATYRTWTDSDWFCSGGFCS